MSAYLGVDTLVDGVANVVVLLVILGASFLLGAIVNR